MKLVIYKTRLGPQRGYRWRLVASNGRTIANGGQGYSRRIDMERAIERVTGAEFRGDVLCRIDGDDYDLIPIEDRT